MSMPSLNRRTLLIGTIAALTTPGVKAATPRRIVSVGGAITEILYRLGIEGDIVGVDTTSVYPVEALKTKPNIGYVRALGAEGILSLSPSQVLAIEGAGPPDVLKIVEQAGVPIVRVPDEPTEAGVTRRIDIIARAVNAQDKGAALIREVEQGFAKLNEDRKKLGQAKRVLFILSLQNGRPLVGGRGTTADAILALAGATNAASGLEGWKPLSDEGVMAAAPEAIVMMNHGPGGAPADPFALPAFTSVPAAKDRKLIVMDGLYLLGFGPRAPQAAQDLMAALNAKNS